MLRKFFDGLVFGSGFSLAFVAIVWGSISILFPMSFHGSEQPVAINSQAEQSIQQPQQPTPQFYELSIEEQIKQASVIGLARFEPSSDGQKKAIFREFLKREPNTTFYYNIGDEYPSASYYPKEGIGHGDGVIVFFEGSPASMKVSMTYTGNRIHSLGDIPIELFKKKCEKPDA